MSEVRVKRGGGGGGRLLVRGDLNANPNSRSTFREHRYGSRLNCGFFHQAMYKPWRTINLNVSDVDYLCGKIQPGITGEVMVADCQEQNSFLCQKPPGEVIHREN